MSHPWFFVVCVVLLVISIAFMLWKQSQVCTFDCGHTTPRKVTTVVHGAEMTCIVDLANRTLCPNCEAAMATRCGYCGDPIFPGQTIALHTLTDERKKMLHAGTHICEDNTFVCCAKCVDALELNARWVAPGKAERVEFEELFEIVNA